MTFWGNNVHNCILLAFLQLHLMSLSWTKGRGWLQMKEEVRQWGSELMVILLSSINIYGGFTPQHLLNSQILMEKISQTTVTEPPYLHWLSRSLLTADILTSRCLELLMETEGTVLRQTWEGTFLQHPISLEHVLHTLIYSSLVSWLLT